MGSPGPDRLPSNVENLRQLLEDGFLMHEVESNDREVVVVLGFDDLRVTLTLGPDDAEQVLALGLGGLPPARRS